MAAQSLSFEGVESSSRLDGKLAGGRGPSVVSDLLKSRLAHCPNASAESDCAEGQRLRPESSLSPRDSALRKVDWLLKTKGERFWSQFAAFGET